MQITHLPFSWLLSSKVGAKSRYISHIIRALFIVFIVIVPALIQPAFIRFLEQLLFISKLRSALLNGQVTIIMHFVLTCRQ